jgi:hypothetical protein
MTARTATSERAALRRSSRPASGSLNSGSSRGPIARRSAITGTARRKTEPHQKNSSNTPPSSGPTAPPSEKAVIQTPMANVRCPGSPKRLRISERVDGAMVAPAIPRSARAAISISGLVENAVSTEAAAKPAAPMSKRRRRPIRSPSVPIVMRAPATMNP